MRIWNSPTDYPAVSEMPLVTLSEWTVANDDGEWKPVLKRSYHPITSYWIAWAVALRANNAGIHWTNWKGIEGLRGALSYSYQNPYQSVAAIRSTPAVRTKLGRWALMGRTGSL